MFTDRRRFLTSCLAIVGVAGCAGKNRDPIEASASAPAHLPDDRAADAGFEEVVAEKTTVETTVEVRLQGDVQITIRRDVFATVFRRVYAAADGTRFGLLTSPLVEPVEDQDVTRDPLLSVDDGDLVELATDMEASSIDDWADAGSVTLIGEEVPLAATVTGGDSPKSVRRAHAETDEDGVTALVVSPEDGTEPSAPFDAVRYEG